MPIVLENYFLPFVLKVDPKLVSDLIVILANNNLSVYKVLAVQLTQCVMKGMEKYAPFISCCEILRIYEVLVTQLIECDDQYLIALLQLGSQIPSLKTDFLLNTQLIRQLVEQVPLKSDSTEAYPQGSQINLENLALANDIGQIPEPVRR